MRRMHQSTTFIVQNTPLRRDAGGCGCGERTLVGVPATRDAHKGPHLSSTSTRVPTHEGGNRVRWLIVKGHRALIIVRKDDMQQNDIILSDNEIAMLNAIAIHASEAAQ